MNVEIAIVGDFDPTRESHRCSFGLNPRYRDALEAAGLRVSATGADGEARILELDDHPFFVLTPFLPQARSTPAAPHLPAGRPDGSGPQGALVRISPVWTRHSAA